MNVASLKLCKELYELSEWENTEYWHYAGLDGVHREDELSTLAVHMKVRPECPAYDLGYLLRKLQTLKLIELKHLNDLRATSKWVASYTPNHVHERINRKSDTPEDAAAKLCIELFKYKVLIKEEH